MAIEEDAVFLQVLKAQDHTQCPRLNLVELHHNVEALTIEEALVLCEAGEAGDVEILASEVTEVVAVVVCP